jgi:hypothetical protein
MVVSKSLIFLYILIILIPKTRESVKWNKYIPTNLWWEASLSMIHIQHTKSVTHGGWHGEAQVDPEVMQQMFL